MADAASLRASAVTLRRIRVAREDGATWRQVAPLIGCADGRSAKRVAHLLERELHPVAARMRAAQQMADQAQSQHTG